MKLEQFTRSVFPQGSPRPEYASDTVVEYVVPATTLIGIATVDPFMQGDLIAEKVEQMVASYRANPSFCRFKNTIVMATVLFATPPQLYLVDGQHRVQMIKQLMAEELKRCCAFRVIVYAIASDTELHHLFRELNYDSFKNANMVSLSIDKALYLKEVVAYLDAHPFKKKHSESAVHPTLYTVKEFMEAAKPYFVSFTEFKNLKEDLETAQLAFCRACDWSTCYKQETHCIMVGHIMPIINCNFAEYLSDRSVLPIFQGKGGHRTINQTMKRLVWDKWVGMDKGSTKCYACDHATIYQSHYHCGHVLASKKGGKTEVANLRPICQQCNSSMGTMNMEEFILGVRSA